MRLPFDANGRLRPGIHWITWLDMTSRFGFNERRIQLLSGLKDALILLKLAGCRTVYVDGSFVTAKPLPMDFDACWAIDGVDPGRLDPVFLDFSNSRERQKERFRGEFFPADLPEGLTGKTFLEFFQTDKESAARKGIVVLDLRRLRQ